MYAIHSMTYFLTFAGPSALINNIANVTIEFYRPDLTDCVIEPGIKTLFKSKINSLISIFSWTNEIRFGHVHN